MGELVKRSQSERPLDKETSRTIKRLGGIVRKKVREIALDDVHDLCPDTLAGCCAIASMELKQLLKREGITARFIVGAHRNDDHGGDHCWLLVTGKHGNAIVDVTATQYGDEKIVIAPQNDERYVEELRGRRAEEEISAFPSWQQPVNRYTSRGRK